LSESGFSQLAPVTTPASWLTPKGLMSRKLRITVGVLIFVISISLLIWGFLPTRREIRIQNISPSEMQLPTPSSLLIQPEVAL